MSVVDWDADRLLDGLGDVMRDLAVAHSSRLRDLGAVRVLALDPCPRCFGNVVASESVARCTRCDYTVGGGVQ